MCQKKNSQFEGLLVVELFYTFYSFNIYSRFSNLNQ